MDILSIKERPLSSVIASKYKICESCNIVDTNKNRSAIGYKCPICNTSSDGSHQFFELNIQVLINLIQEALHSKSPFSHTSNIDSYSVSIVMFFCTIREMLLEQFLLKMLKKQNIPGNIISMIRKDNKLYTQMLNNVFKTVTGEKWKNIINVLSKSSKNDYSALNTFIIEISDIRNEFIHEGRKWNINKSLTEECVNKLPVLLELYVDMHNKFIHEVKIENGT